MNQNHIVVAAVFAVFVLMLGQFPSSLTDSNSAVKDARQGIVIDAVVSTGEKAIAIAGERALDTACCNDSENCSQSMSIVGTSMGVVAALGVIAIFAGMIAE